MELVSEKIEMISFDCPFCQTGAYMMPNVENIMTAGDYYHTSAVKCFKCNRIEIDGTYNDEGEFVGIITFNSPNYDDVEYVWENGKISINSEDIAVCRLEVLPSSEEDFKRWEKCLIDAGFLKVEAE